jgi:hypothetical protein
MARHDIETDTTRASARLPGLEIEIVHRRPTDDVEQLSINVQAMPSFEAFGRYLETTNPFDFWARAMQMAWLPWLEAARMMMLPQPFTQIPPPLRSPYSKDHDAQG